MSVVQMTVSKMDVYKMIANKMTVGKTVDNIIVGKMTFYTR